MDQEVLENHQQYVERIAFYRNFGYDLEKEREFIIDASLPLSGAILEIGTGKGHCALALAKRGFHFTTIDVSEQEQHIARLNLRYAGLDKQVVWRIENAEQLSFSNQSFDVVFSINVYHHLQRPFVVLDEMIRVLRPQGKIVLSDFTDKGLEIINDCHTHEGRQHDHGHQHLDEARVYFTQKGYVVKEVSSVVQRVMIITRDSR